MAAAGTLLQSMSEGGHEQVVHLHEPSCGLRAIIAIHSTVLGPGLGGTRCYPYASEEAALEDVLRLARAMTYKNAAAGLDFGGGKAVIIGAPAEVKSEALLRAYGRFIDTLGGRYRTAEDVGTTQADMDVIRRETAYVTGASPTLGGSGDPSEATAWGVRCAMHAVAAHLGRDSLEGMRFVVSGAGKVGRALVGHLVEEGGNVIVADIDPAALSTVRDHHRVTTVAAEDAHRTACDIFSPCALGAVLTQQTVAELSCRAVVGAANNQLADAGSLTMLHERGIVYAPDYVVNAGGVINIAEEARGYDRARAWANVARIEQTTKLVLDTAGAEGITTLAAADRIAEARIAGVGAVAHLRAFPTRRR